MSNLRLLVLIVVIFGVVASVQAQDESKFLFNIGGGIGFPRGDLSRFVNNGANFVVGGGHNFTKAFGVDAEFMWHDLPINSSAISDEKPRPTTLHHYLGFLVFARLRWLESP
jgi:hypothetical protein